MNLMKTVMRCSDGEHVSEMANLDTTLLPLSMDELAMSMLYIFRRLGLGR